jgi:hypothetical protein
VRYRRRPLIPTRAQVAGQASHQLPGERLNALGDHGGPHPGRDARCLDVVATPHQMAFVRPVADARSGLTSLEDDHDPGVGEMQCRGTKMRLRGAEQRDGSIGDGWEERMHGAQEPIRLLGGEQADQRAGGAHGAFASC